MRSMFKDKLAALGYSTYPQYLNSDHWKKFSNEVRKDYCFCCDSSKMLDVHHITYRNLGSELVDDVVTVCRVCHDAIHARVRFNTPLNVAHIHQRDKVNNVHKIKDKINNQRIAAKKSGKKIKKKRHTRRTIANNRSYLIGMLIKYKIAHPYVDCTKIDRMNACSNEELEILYKEFFGIPPKPIQKSLNEERRAKKKKNRKMKIKVNTKSATSQIS